MAGGLFTGGGAGLFAILPQPMSVPATTAKSSRARSVFNFRRRAGTPKKSTAARAMPPPTGTIRRSESWTTEADAGVVLIVSVVVTGAVPEIVTGAEAEQLCKSVAFAGKTITAQVTPTDPVNPAAGVIVTVEVTVAPGDAMLAEVAVTVKLGGTMMLGAMTVKLISVPERLVPLLKA